MTIEKRLRHLERLIDGGDRRDRDADEARRLVVQNILGMIRQIQATCEATGPEVRAGLEAAMADIRAAVERRAAELRERGFGVE